MLNFDKIKETDPQVFDLVEAEYNRQNNGIELIASENMPSEAVLQAQSCYHTLKYAEGYPSARYYGGCAVIDATEQLAIDRACELFGCKYANVQPHSGAQANMAVQFALLKPEDTLMGMSLNSGGHLTHGAKPTFSGKNYHVIQYEVDDNTYEIDYNGLRNEISFYVPRLFIAGASAYPRQIDFKKIREIIDDINKTIYDHTVFCCESGYSKEEQEKAIREMYDRRRIYFMVDMAHIAGLVAAGLHQSPIPYADIVTSTTHKTLRGPRGGLILWNDDSLTKKINSAVFPGIQGGPLENIIAAKAVCFGEALKPEFKEYMKKVLDNTKCLANSLKKLGVNVLTNGTDNHLLLIDLTKDSITGKELEQRLEEVGITTNKNAIPFDKKNKKETSGLRLGTAAITSRGFGYDEITTIAEVIADCLNDRTYANNKNDMKEAIQHICKKFPMYK